MLAGSTGGTCSIATHVHCRMYVDNKSINAPKNPGEVEISTYNVH